jgi:putative methyltransferase
MDSRFKIKFIANGTNERFHGVQLNPAFLFLKDYYEFKGHGHAEWLPWVPLMIDSEEEQIQTILEERPDILCFTVHVWNYKRHYSMAKRIRELLPNTVIVMGGPQLVAHKDKDFFKKHPYVDYVCYGDGEEAFQILIDKLAGEDVPPLVNMVENVNGETLVHEYRLFFNDEYAKRSKYLEQRELVIQVTNDLIGKGFRKAEIEWQVEYSRGCMYKCAYCDWSQNLSKKVKRYKQDWRAELDFFKELDVMVQPIDANFGQWPEDLSILDYAISLYDPNKNFRMIVNNTPKLKKEAIHQIHNIQAKTYANSKVFKGQMGNYYFVPLQLQDIHTDVLDAINRPSIPYPDIVKMMERFKVDLEGVPFTFTPIMMVGFPGQTYDSMMNMFRQLVLDGIYPHVMNIHWWVCLENSPGADPLYAKMNGLEWIDVYTFNIGNPALNKGDIDVNEVVKWPVEKLYDEISKGFHHMAISNLKVVKKNKTLDLFDIVRVKNFLNDLRVYARDHQTLPWRDSEFLDKKFAEISEQARLDTVAYFEQHQKYIDKYGFMVTIFDVDGVRRVITI